MSQARGRTEGERTASEVAIEARNLGKRYDETLVFEDLNFGIERGEIFCLLGPSGCGKTTLLNLLAGLEDPTEGGVYFEGDRVEGPDYRRGVVFQDPHLYPWLTVRENIEFGPDVRGKEVDDERVDKLIEMIGLGEFKDATPAELSGGMAQRVSLARTLANDPEMLLMDEPTSALDALTQRELQDELVDIIRSLDLTTVYVTHDVEEAVYLGDRVAVMSDRPSRIKGIEEIEMEERDRGSDEFGEYQQELLGLLGVNEDE